MSNRSSGILLHPTSLPETPGIGTIGKQAYKFVDFLSENKAAVLGNEGMTLLFLAIGVWISWNIITKTNDTDVKKF